MQNKQLSGPGERAASQRASACQGLIARVAMLAPFAFGASLAAAQSHGQGGSGVPGHFGVVVGLDAGGGGDEVLDVEYTDGSYSKIRAGEGVTFDLGLHYHPYALPLDFAATFGYKTAGSKDRDSDLGIDRYVLKLFAYVDLPNRFWISAGPVWHLSPKVNGDGYFDDIKFDDAVGGSVGFGWWFVGVSYTSIKYRVAGLPEIDGSNVELNLVARF